MQLSPAAFVIYAFGGVRKTARAIGRTPSAVSKWQKLGAIPSAAQILILQAAKKRGLKITANDLMFGKKISKKK